MNKRAILVSVLAGLLLFASAAAAHADELAAVPQVARAQSPTMLIGARVGGYGFRESAPGGGGTTGWNDCRMNGLGLFAERGWGRFFVEGGVDAYFADDFGSGFLEEGAAMEDPGAWPLDRFSGLASVAGGVRFFEGSRVSPYVQVGFGVELTKVTAYDLAGEPRLEDSFVLPLGFIGIGGDLRLGGVRVGASFRVHAMGNFEADAAMTELSPETELAAQGQFYAKFAL